MRLAFGMGPAPRNDPTERMASREYLALTASGVIRSAMFRIVDKLAAEVHACGGCAAVAGREPVLEMDRPRGIFPRGLFVWPPGKDLTDADLVILGENPGRAPAAERAMYVLLNEHHSWQTDPLAALDRLSAALGDGDWEEGGNYWRNAVRLVRALYPRDLYGRPGGFPCTVAGMELAYCQSPAAKVAGKKHWDALNTCAKVHLSKHLRTVSDETVVMCLGGPAAAWMRNSEHANRLRWCWVDHLSGSWGSLYRLIRMDEGVARLWPCVEDEWKRVRDGGGPAKLGEHHGRGNRRCDFPGCDWHRTNFRLATDEAQDSVPPS